MADCTRGSPDSPAAAPILRRQPRFSGGSPDSPAVCPDRAAHVEPLALRSEEDEQLHRLGPQARGRAAGSRTVNAAPAPCPELVANRPPPWATAMARLMVSPIPLPPCWRLRAESAR